jgi:hypothetical protein
VVAAHKGDEGLLVTGAKALEQVDLFGHPHVGSVLRIVAVV